MPNSEIIQKVVDTAYEIDKHLKFPEAEAIVPLNPHHIGPYMAGAAFASEFARMDDKLNQ